MDHYLSGSLALFFAGLGVSFAPHVWLGGLVLAAAGASLAFYHDPERDTRERWVVYMTALFTAHFVAMAAFWMWPSFPPQFVMGGAGFLSRKIVRTALRVASLIEAQGNGIAAGIVNRVLPGAYRYRDDPSDPDANGEGQ